MLMVAIYESLKDSQGQMLTHPPPSNADAEILSPSSSQDEASTEGEISEPSVICNHRPSDVDMADSTKETVPPTTNIIDGFLRRWDIFRNR